MGTVPTEYFDNSYFGIHRQQCTFMDPMQRLILERTFEALIDAGTCCCNSKTIFAVLICLRGESNRD